MLFTEYGNKNKKTILLLHGMMQDWHSLYDLLQPLEKDYCLIIPAQDGFYDGSQDFTTFADQAKQIEEYIKEHHKGKVDGACGFSQGGLMLTELLTRNNIEIGTAIMDGCYVAHQGRLSAKVMIWMFKKYKNTGTFPKFVLYLMHKMGLKEEDLGIMKLLYTKPSDNTIERNFTQNYLYRTRPELANTKAKVYMMCGSKEKYAIKSQKILKKYLTNYEEEIMPGLGHGEFLFKHPNEFCEKIKSIIK